MFLGEEEIANVHLLLLNFNIICSPYDIYLFLTECVHVHGGTQIPLSIKFGRNSNCSGGAATFWFLMTQC